LAPVATRFRLRPRTIIASAVLVPWFTFALFSYPGLELVAAAIAIPSVALGLRLSRLHVAERKGRQVSGLGTAAVLMLGAFLMLAGVVDRDPTWFALLGYGTGLAVGILVRSISANHAAAPLAAGDAAQPSA